MNDSEVDVMQRLRSADPARGEMGRFSPGERAAMLTSIQMAAEAGSPSVRPAAGRGRWRLVAVGAAAVVATTLAVFLAPILWPNHAEAPMAYGITSKPDGTVDVLLHWSQLIDVGQTQAALRANGVPAVVMRQTSDCVGDTTGDHNIAVSPLVIQRLDGGVRVRPSKIPHGDYIVFGLPPVNTAIPVLYVFVTSTPPPCIPAPVSIPAPAAS